ncbi:MAG: hypothetical protein GYB37_02560 [Algicola sp.]|nr:hypothetical protein [Algicola sp.]
MKANEYKHHLRIAVIYFGIAALLGLLLRSYAILPFRFNFKYMVHGHSHIALLGWVYVALTTMLHYIFVDQQVSTKKYKRIFWGTQGTLIGMLLTFPFQGYALYSIVFSTLFIILSYTYTYHFWKNIDSSHKGSKSLKLVKAALIYMVISSIGPWALGAIMNTLGAASIWYRLSIYFYLHFQYNGWMILALIGLFIYLMERLELELPKKTFTYFFNAINLSIVLTFLLSTLWTDASPWLNILSGVGAVVQLYAFVLIWGMTKHKVKKVQISKVQGLLLNSVIILATIKIILQLLSAFPYFANMASDYLDLTIGYLHLTFLGIVSLGLLFMMDHLKLFQVSKVSFLLYLAGFVLTELLIFYKGFAAWQLYLLFDEYASILFICSILIFLGLVLMIYQNFRKA